MFTTADVLECAKCGSQSILNASQTQGAGEMKLPIYILLLHLQFHEAVSLELSNLALEIHVPVYFAAVSKVSILVILQVPFMYTYSALER